MNNAISLDGSSQYLKALNYTAVNSLTNFTFEGWYYNSDASSTYALLASIANTSPLDFFELQRDQGGQAAINFTTRYSSANADGYSLSNILPLNTWSYIAIVHSTSDHKTRIYYGSAATQASYSLQNTGSGTEQSPSGMDIYLAYDPKESGSGKLKGAVGGFMRLWNTAQTSAQLAANYNLNLQSANETGLIGNWKFAEGSGSTVANEVSGGNAFSTVGSPTWTTGPTITDKTYGGVYTKGNFFQLMRA